MHPLLRERRLSRLYVAAVSGVRAVLMPDTVLSAGTGTGPVSKPIWRKLRKGRSVKDDVSGGAE